MLSRKRTGKGKITSGIGALTVFNITLLHFELTKTTFKVIFSLIYASINSLS